jgi:hypothetical protein
MLARQRRGGSIVPAGAFLVLLPIAVGFGCRTNGGQAKADPGLASTARDSSLGGTVARGSEPDSFSLLLLAAGRSMIASARGEPYDPAFECAPGDLTSSYVADDVRAMRGVKLLYVGFGLTAGVDSRVQPGRKVHAWGVAFPDKSVVWTRVIPPPSPNWLGPQSKVGEAPLAVRRATSELLDPSLSPGCTRALRGSEIAPTLCAMRAPSSSWEKECIDTFRREEKESAETCSTLAASRGPEPREVAIELTASFGVDGRERGVIRVRKATFESERLCLRQPTVSHYFETDPSGDGGTGARP